MIEGPVWLKTFGISSRYKRESGVGSWQSGRTTPLAVVPYVVTLLPTPDSLLPTVHFFLFLIHKSAPTPAPAAMAMIATMGTSIPVAVAGTLYVTSTVLLSVFPAVSVAWTVILFPPSFFLFDTIVEKEKTSEKRKGGALRQAPLRGAETVPFKRPVVRSHPCTLYTHAPSPPLHP